MEVEAVVEVGSEAGDVEAAVDVVDAVVEEVADAVLWMASGQASFMTGHALVLDGGASC